MHDFRYAALPSHVVFGAGVIGTLADELDRLGLGRLVVVSTAGQRAAARSIGRWIGARCAGYFAGAAMHTPVDVTRHALARIAPLDADGLIAFGGGSAIGLSKAIALRTGLPQIAIPTTYTGSEMTPILGETENGLKTTQSAAIIQPGTVLYDPDLTMDLPVSVSGVSGLNAMAHAVEALYARNGNPITSLMAAEGVRVLARALPVIATTPGDRQARSDALYGAWLCGVCLGTVGMALHHKICHALGGTFGLPHAQTHAVMLPHVLAYNAPAAPDAMAALAAALGDADPARALFEIGRTVGAPAGLRALGMAESDIDRALALVLANPYWNPRPLERGALRAMLARAWAGSPPASE
ncbi:MAG: maleylacetate reductase [Novosphingobium sp.]|nr:maleylacetate reductase [Novosphingobium sp.]